MGIGALALALLVGSCSSTPDGPPKAQDNACLIFAERPGWREAIMDSSQRWGTPPHVKMAIIWRESSFRSNVRPGRRSFLGVTTGYASSAF
ncbi:MAG: hypothetical protein AAFW01_13110, partial [Pseudomonadota bacterium]